jgi:hypothetical protein
MSFWYLATPYALYPEGRQAAYTAAVKQAAYLLVRGIPVFSPIAHNHPISQFIPEHDGDFKFWVRFVDLSMMEEAGGLIVCMLSGWEESVGMRYEIERFRGMGKQVVHMEPASEVFYADYGKETCRKRAVPAYRPNLPPNR